MEGRPYLITILLLALFSSSSCTKNKDVETGNVIFNLSSDTGKPGLLADGSTIITLKCNLNTRATADRRSILFTTSAGKFIAAKDTSVLSQKAVFINNELVATVRLIVPQQPGNIQITAQPDILDLKNNNYILPLTLSLAASMPARIKLSSTTFVLASGFGSEATITGTLQNRSGGKVSLGNKVFFKDYLPGGGAANGTFRSTIDTTGAASTVSTFYSIGTVPLNTRVYIVATTIGDGGQDIKDTLYFNINK